MRRAILVAVVLAALGAAGAEEEKARAPEKGDTVYFPIPLSWRLGTNTLIYQNIPYSRMECYGTRDCRYEVGRCEPFELVKQTATKTKLRKDGLRWTIRDGDLRPITYTSVQACHKAVVDLAEQRAAAAAKEDGQ